MELIFQLKREIQKDIPWLLEIPKSLVQDWFYDYSVLDFLADGKIFREPEKYGSPKWAKRILNKQYIMTPTKVETLNGRYLKGWCYFEDNPYTKKMELVHYENPN